jgi:hypothetical protein
MHAVRPAAQTAGLISRESFSESSKPLRLVEARPQHRSVGGFGIFGLSFFFGFKLRDRREVVVEIKGENLEILLLSRWTYIDVANSDSAGHFVGVGGWIWEGMVKLDEIDWA